MPRERARCAGFPQLPLSRLDQRLLPSCRQCPFSFLSRAPPPPAKDERELEVNAFASARRSYKPGPTRQGVQVHPQGLAAMAPALTLAVVAHHPPTGRSHFVLLVQCSDVGHTSRAQTSLPRSRRRCSISLRGRPNCRMKAESVRSFFIWLQSEQTQTILRVTDRPPLAIG